MLATRACTCNALQTGRACCAAAPVSGKKKSRTRAGGQGWFEACRDVHMQQAGGASQGGVGREACAGGKLPPRLWDACIVSESHGPRGQRGHLCPQKQLLGRVGACMQRRGGKGARRWGRHDWEWRSGARMRNLVSRRRLAPWRLCSAKPSGRRRGRHSRCPWPCR